MARRLFRTLLPGCALVVKEKAGRFPAFEVSVRWYIGRAAASSREHPLPRPVPLEFWLVLDNTTNAEELVVRS